MTALRIGIILGVLVGQAQAGEWGRCKSRPPTGVIPGTCTWTESDELASDQVKGMEREAAKRRALPKYNHTITEIIKPRPKGFPGTGDVCIYTVNDRDGKKVGSYMHHCYFIEKPKALKHEGE